MSDSTSHSEKPYARLGRLIRDARTQAGLKQIEVQEALGLAPGTLAHWEAGDRVGSTTQMRAVCDLLDIDFPHFINRWIECEPQPQVRDGLKLLAEDMGGQMRSDLHGFDVRTLIMGDRRDSPAESVADILALQVSIGDLFFLAELQRPMQIWFDKLVDLLSPEVLLRRFEHDILVLGSPAVNLAARNVNRKAAFRFHVPPDMVELEGRLRAELKESIGRSTERQDQIERVINANRGHGFIDPMASGISNLSRSNMEYGILSVSRHPWQSDRIAILAAGQKGPSTAAALRLLARKGCFENHPLGGLFSVSVPHTLEVIDRWEALNPEWHTRPYTLDEYRDATRRHEHCSAEFVDDMERLTTTVDERRRRRGRRP